MQKEKDRQADELQDKIALLAEQQAELNNLQNSNGDLQKDLLAKQKELQDLQKCREEISDLKNQINLLTAQIEHKDNEIQSS